MLRLWVRGLLDVRWDKGAPRGPGNFEASCGGPLGASFGLLGGLNTASCRAYTRIIHVLVCAHMSVHFVSLSLADGNQTRRDFFARRESKTT